MNLNFCFSWIVNLLDVKILQVGNIELRVQYRTVLSSCNLRNTIGRLCYILSVNLVTIHISHIPNYFS